ncbi:MAG: hypothetical protein HYR73_02815 [Candidatus Eisenbacteria bacterium]|nr:hypothetical protein [Candidatus Eisenbacteria bacterium]
MRHPLVILIVLAFQALPSAPTDDRVPGIQISETVLAKPGPVLPLKWGEVLLLPSPDLRHVAYAEFSRSGEAVVLDGIRQKTFKSIFWPSVTFSPNSQRILYVAAIDKSDHLVLDSVQGAPYKDVCLPIFSPDSRRICCDPYFVRHPVSATVCCSRRNSAGDFIPSEECGAKVL